MSNITLLNIDCMEYMATVPDNHFDLAIVDQPYGIGENGDKNKTRGKWAKDYHSFAGGDKNPPPPQYFIELKRISKNQIIFGANHFANEFDSSSSCWIVWDKQNSGHFADCEIAYTSFKTAVRKFSFKWNGMLQGDMKNKEFRIHPTQKPVKLYDWILQNYAKPGQRIIDTHFGSASSAISSHYFGCDFVGCELDKEYYDLAVERFGLATSQTTFFDMGFL